MIANDEMNRKEKERLLAYIRRKGSIFLKRLRKNIKILIKI
jgi:hypothetical protein